MRSGNSTSRRRSISIAARWRRTPAIPGFRAGCCGCACRGRCGGEPGPGPGPGRGGAGTRAGGKAAFDRALVVLRLVVDAVRREDWPDAARRLEGPGGTTLSNSVRLLPWRGCARRWATGSGGNGARRGREGKGRRGAGRRCTAPCCSMSPDGRQRPPPRSTASAMRDPAGARVAEAAYRMASGDADSARRLLRRFREMGGQLYAEEPTGLAPLVLTPSTALPRCSTAWRRGCSGGACPCR